LAASTFGLQRVAVLYQDDAFGQVILQSIDASEKECQLQLISKVAYEARAKDLAPQAKSIEAAKPQALFTRGVPDSAYQFTKTYRAPVGAAQIYALSFVTPKMLAERRRAKNTWLR
jgi:ABC-type branched-subunit amino acid transport system substrate-binding protein